MSDDDPNPPEPSEPDLGRTEEYPTIASGLEAPTAVDEGLPLEDGGEDDDWPTRGPARGIRLGVPFAGLLAVLLVAAGFWGGAVLEKNHGSSTLGGGNGGLAGLAARFRAAAAGATGATGATGASGGSGFPGFGGSSSAAAGTISVVDGDTLYVLTSTGALIKVTLTPSTTVTRNAKSPAIGLRPGDTVVIQGATGRNGNVAATSVAATAPGVSSSGGGFGFGRGLGGGPGSTTTTTGSGG